MTALLCLWHNVPLWAFVAFAIIKVHVFIHILLYYMKDLAIIGQLEYTTPQKRGNKEQTEEKPQGCYIFLASSNGTLLVKSLAVRELLLPCQTGSGIEGFTEEASDNINSSLEKVYIVLFCEVFFKVYSV